MKLRCNLTVWVRYTPLRSAQRAVETKVPFIVLKGIDYLWTENWGPLITNDLSIFSSFLFLLKIYIDIVTADVSPATL